jgi:hypothetical protein
MCGCGFTRNRRSTEPKKKILVVALGCNRFRADRPAGTQHVAPLQVAALRLSKRPFQAFFGVIDKE